MSFIPIETLLIIAALLALIRYYIHRKWQFLANRNIPHDPPSILKFGNLRDAMSMSKEAFHRDLANKKKYGLIYGYYSGVEPVIVCHDMEIMRQVYIKEFQRFPDRMNTLLSVISKDSTFMARESVWRVYYENMPVCLARAGSKLVLQRMNGKEMNHGVLGARGKKWKRLRSTLTPTFSVAKLRQMFLITQECTAETAKVLEGKCKEENGQFVARQLFSNLSLDVIVSSALGTKVNSQSSDGKNSRLVKEVRNLFVTGFAGLTALACFVFPPIEWLFEKLGVSIFPSDSITYVRDFTHAVIEDRLNGKSIQNHTDLLQLMLDAEVPCEEITDDSIRGITRIELIGNAMLMIGAGFENTANAMVFLAYNLAFHPDVQVRLQEEIDAAFAVKNCFDHDTVKSLKYLSMCLNESLRLYCPIWINSRVCREEATVNGLTIPNGVTVQFPTFGLAHDPDYWDDPWEYLPERMEDMSKIDPMVFQPFGAGPRNCIGLKFAEMEIKMVFCEILHKFTLKPCENTPKPPLELTFKLGVRPIDEFKLRVEPRS